jgi:hypothetical protein
MGYFDDDDEASQYEPLDFDEPDPGCWACDGSGCSDCQPWYEAPDDYLGGYRDG